jgi:hypothetical protein
MSTEVRQGGGSAQDPSEEQSANVIKTQGGSTPLRSSTPKPSIAGTPQAPSAKKGAFVASPSTQPPADQPMDDKKKGANDKEILADPSNLDKKL